MHPDTHDPHFARRQFLFFSACSVGSLAAASLLQRDGLAARESPNPLSPRPPHHEARARNCTFIFLAGGPSQLDMYDPKPKLVELHNHPLLKEMTERVRFAFSLWLAGGGVKGGQVIGKTDELGWNPVLDPIHINDLHATLLYLFGFDHLKLAVPFGGLDIRLTNLGGKVVKKLLA